MPLHSLRLQIRELLFIIGPAVLVTIFAFWLAYQFVEPAPPRHIVITTGSETGAYHAFAKGYAEVLARSGVTLEVKPSKGSVENLARLNDTDSDYQVALLQGGIGDAKSAPHVQSLGRVFLEPLWVFTGTEASIDSLADMAGKRVAIGPEGSGTRALSLVLLARNGVSETTARLLPLGGDAAAQALRKGEADAIFLSLAPQTALVQGLLADPGVRILSFTHAEAYARLLPYLQHVILPRGIIDFARDQPREDVHLLGALAMLAARDDLHPALVSLLVSAAQEVHSGRGLFQQAGEFPKAADPDFEMSSDAVRAYKQGVPFLRRALPFWLATFLERMMVMALPLATILLPLVRIVPKVYEWRLRRRMLYWYGELKRLEKRFAQARLPEERANVRADINRIEDAVASIPLPVRLSGELYGLRNAIDLVRNRIVHRAPA